MPREVVVISDSEPELVSVNDGESDKVEDEREQQVEAEGPTIQADMARFPGKSRKEIKTARGLWASGTILVRNQDEEDPDKINVFIPRNLICSISGRVRDIVPTARSWPVIEWKTIANGGWRNRIEMDVWPWMPEFIKFLHTGARVFDDHEDAYYTGEWCLGAVLDCPEYQNAIMKEMLRSETLVETDMVGMGEDENELLRMFVDTYAHHLPRIGVTSIGNGKLDRSNKLAAYIIDLMGGCVANILARAQVDAAKKSAPRFPPWHVFNRHKYLMDEKHPTAELKRGGEKGPGGSKKRGRAA